MESNDITIEILKDIRSELRDTREELGARIDQTNERLDQTNGRLDHVDSSLGGRIDAMRDELSRRIVASEVRTATAITDLAGSVHELTGVLREQADLRPRVERCERDIDDLKRRMPH
jgi:uncharacterized protein Yka (UPF0111/DUF47 family)